MIFTLDSEDAQRSAQSWCIRANLPTRFLSTGNLVHAGGDIDLGVGIGVALVVDLLTNPSARSSGSIASTGICLGTSILLLLLIIKLSVSDFKKWAATRGIRLLIYENGFTYQSDGKQESCRWDEIKDITFSTVEYRSKASPPRRINVIRSIVRADDEFITLPDSLNLMSITPVIKAARQRVNT